MPNSAQHTDREVQAITVPRRAIEAIVDGYLANRGTKDVFVTCYTFSGHGPKALRNCDHPIPQALMELDAILRAKR